MIRLSLPLSQFFDVFRLEEPRVPQAIDDRIYLVHDDALDREHVTQDITQNSVTVVGANTATITAWSHAQDHYLQGVAVEIVANPANVEYVALYLQPFGDPQNCLIGLAVAADIVALVDLNHQVPLTMRISYPFFARRETDYTMRVRTNAGGGATVRLSSVLTRAVEGVRIAR